MNNIFKTPQEITSVGKDVEKRECLCIVGGMKQVQPLWKTICSSLKKLKIELLYDPAMPLLDIYPKELKSVSQRNTHVHCSIIYNSQDIETT